MSPVMARVPPPPKLTSIKFWGGLQGLYPAENPPRPSTPTCMGTVTSHGNDLPPAKEARTRTLVVPLSSATPARSASEAESKVRLITVGDASLSMISSWLPTTAYAVSERVTSPPLSRMASLPSATASSFTASVMSM